MKSSLLILICLSLSLIATAQTPAALAPLKVVTLNFNSEIVPVDGDFRMRDKRFNAMVKWVADNNPDVIFLEEAWSYRADKSVAQTLARAIGYDLSFRLEMGFFDFFTEADAVLTKKSLGMVQPFAVKLPHSAIEFGDGKSWVIELGSVSYAVGAKVTVAGAPIYVYATHLTGSTPAARGDQAAAVIQDAKSRTAKEGIPWSDANVIVAGDFNSIASEVAPQDFVNAGFTDSFLAMHPGDQSCSICELPDQPWFDPFTLAAGLFPSQASDNSYARFDYIFNHGPVLKPAASTLMFTSPIGGMWMSDHYGVMTTFADPSLGSFANPTHDQNDTLPMASLFAITKDVVSCKDCDQGGNGQAPDLTSLGARGIVLQNKSGIPLNIEISGPGGIYAGAREGLNDGENAAFTFATTGDYQYNIWTMAVSEDQPGINITGVIHVQSSGY